jgi:hypothetical protein
LESGFRFQVSGLTSSGARASSMTSKLRFPIGGAFPVDWLFVDYYAFET